MRRTMLVYCCLVVVSLSGCESTKPKSAVYEQSSNQHPDVIYIDGKAFPRATPAWANRLPPPKRVKLTYQEPLQVYSVEGHADHYYNQLKGQLLRYWREKWEMKPLDDYGAKWVSAVEDAVPAPLRQKYESMKSGREPARD